MGKCNCAIPIERDMTLSAEADRKLYPWATCLTGAFQTKEWGYALVRVDERGIGGSQGRLDPFGIERSGKIQADAEGQGTFQRLQSRNMRSLCQQSQSVS